MAKRSVRGPLPRHIAVLGPAAGRASWHGQETRVRIAMLQRYADTGIGLDALVAEIYAHARAAGHWGGDVYDRIHLSGVCARTVRR
jgi:hypothetical protein